MSSIMMPRSLTFRMLDSFGCGITSLLSSFGHDIPCLLNKIYLFCVEKPTFMNYVDDRAPTISPDIS